MATIVGGLRIRLVFDSLKNEIERALTALGWFDGGRQHETIKFITEPINDREPIDFNTIVLVGEDAFVDPLELGSDYAEHRRGMWLDLYAENQSVGEHLAFDLRDILEGRMPSISRPDPEFILYDYTQATPPEVGVVQIENVLLDRARVFSYPWQKHWYSIGFDIIDQYGNDTD